MTRKNDLVQRLPMDVSLKLETVWLCNSFIKTGQTSGENVYINLGRKCLCFFSLASKFLLHCLLKRFRRQWKALKLWRCCHWSVSTDVLWNDNILIKYKKMVIIRLFPIWLIKGRNIQTKLFLYNHRETNHENNHVTFISCLSTT